MAKSKKYKHMKINSKKWFSVASESCFKLSEVYITEKFYLLSLLIYTCPVAFQSKKVSSILNDEKTKQNAAPHLLN